MCVLSHSCAGAAHDSRHGNGAGIVGDHQGVVIQFEFLAIKQGDGFVFFGHADDYIALQQRKIEGVHGLAQLK